MQDRLMASSTFLAENLYATISRLMAWLQAVEAQGHPGNPRKTLVNGKGGEGRALAHVMYRRAEIATRGRLVLGRVDGFIRRHRVEGVGWALLH